MLSRDFLFSAQRVGSWSAGGNRQQLVYTVISGQWPKSTLKSCNATNYHLGITRKLNRNKLNRNILYISGMVRKMSATSLGSPPSDILRVLYEQWLFPVRTCFFQLLGKVALARAVHHTAFVLAVGTPTKNITSNQETLIRGFLAVDRKMYHRPCPTLSARLAQSL